MTARREGRGRRQPPTGAQRSRATGLSPPPGGGEATGGCGIAAPPGGAVKTTPATPTSATFSGLTNATAYPFPVAATNSAGPGPASAASNAVTPVAPLPPPVAHLSVTP